MIIDRDKHNKYVVGWKPNYTVPTNQGSSSGTNVTIVYGGGGSGSSTPVSSEAFSYYKVSDGENAITQEAKVQKDVANLSIIGDEGIKVELITDPTIFEANFTSIGTNEGVYKISYGKVTTVVEQPTKPETQAEEPIEPTEPEVIITFPMVLTYVSGEKIKAEQFDTLRLLNDKEEVATYPSSGLAIEGDVDGILSISLEVYKEVQSVNEEGKPISDAEGNPVMEKQGLYFNKILLTSQLEDQPSTQAEGDSTEEEPQQPTYESLLSFDVVVNIDTVIKLSVTAVSDLWKLDDNGNIYTEYNAYSLKELSAYGLGEGGSGEGVGFLHELGDVSIPDPNAIPDNAILQYNIETGKWEAVELELPEDSATREWVEQKFKDLINGAPADLDTLGEIAIAIQELQQLLDWFSFVDGRIRANYDFWGVGEVSAYGYNTQEQPSGAQYLNDLLDVTISNPTNNQILIYNGSQWVNQVLPESGLNETELAQYLTEHNYVQSSALSQYATITYVDGQVTTISNRITALVGDAPEDLDTLGEIATVIQSLEQLLDWFSFVDGRIRANYDFWGVGEVSAYGSASGSDPGTGGGAGYLHELGDVTINNDTLANGQIIVWDEDSQTWVNVDFSGLDESALALYLTQNKYATQGWVNGQLAPINIKLEEFQTTIDMINDMFEWDNGRIKAKATLYSVGEISAYGAGGGSSGTSGYLHKLDDVLLTDLQNDQLLMYDASIGKWINVDKNSVGLNETELEQYLTTHNYVTSDRAVSPTRRIIAGTGLTGGGALSSDVTLSLATSGVTSGVYTKVTVDQYGRVTLGAFERYVNVTGDIMTGNLILPTLQANTSIILGSVKLEYDSVSNALKISNVNTQQVINLYATGEISAYGYNDGSSSTGGYLHELEDVTLSNLQNGQTLVYNSSTGQWVNTTIQAGGIDEAALAAYLTNNQYATQQWVTSQNYLTVVSVDTISDLHSSWDAVLKAQKPAWLTTVSLATISDLHASWDALLKAAPTDYVTRWPGVSEVKGLHDALNLKLDAATFNDLFEKVEISTGVYAIRAKYGLYSNDWISAKGANPNAGGVVSGVTELSKLSDVQLGTMADGQVLTWDVSSQKWVNKTIEAGLDTAELEEYLTSHNYAKKSDIPALTDYATQEWVNTKLGSYATTSAMNSALGNKVDKVAGKGLSSNDFTDALLKKLNGIEEGANKYVLPTATGSVLGGVKVGATLAIASGVLNMKAVGTAGTYTKVTVDAYGRVTGHTSLAATDIPNLPWSKITSGKPTTLAGYGITDAYTKTEADGRYVNVSGDTMTGSLTVNGDVIAIGSLRSNGKVFFNFGDATLKMFYATNSTQGGITNETFCFQSCFDGQDGETSSYPSAYSSRCVIALQPRGGNVGIGTTSPSYKLHVVGDIYSTTSFRLGSGTITWDATNNCFHFSHGLYSDSFVSAKGANSGSGGTVSGVTKLSDLSDVQLGTLATNQVLSWNGSKWVNKAISTGLDETALAQYLTNNQYLTMPTGDARYVTLATTQTISGEKTFGAPVHIRGNESNNIETVRNLNGSITTNRITRSSSIRNALSFKWYQSDWQIGNIRTGSTDSEGFGITKDNSNLVFRVNENNAWVNGGVVLHTNNYTSYLDSRYLRIVSLATISDLHASWDALLKAAPTVYVTRWPTAAEVGALTQTTADGCYVRDNNASGTTDTNSALSNAVTHNYRWSNAPYNYISSLLDFTYSDDWRTQLFVKHQASTDIWVRSRYNGTTWGSWRTIAFTDSNVASATQLQTARTINGTAFNGTSNIVTSYWGTARTLSLTGNATGSVSMNGSANVSMSVNVNYATSAGNADTLDNLHSSSFFRYIGNNVYSNWNDMTAIGTMRVSQQSITNGPSGAYNFGQLVTFNAGGTLTQLYFPHNTVGAYIRTGWAGVSQYYSWQQLATINSNVASATKLQTAQTIWGRPFDGTAPVSGDMTGVGSISASGNIMTDNALFQIDATNISGDRGLNVLYNGQRLFCGFGASGSKGLFVTQSGSSPGWVLSVPSSTVVAIAQNSGINVGIGTTSPSYKLHVAGTGYFSGALTVSDLITANGGLTTSQYIQIGSARLMWDSEAGALYVLKSDGTACGFYATGFVSAKGANGDGRPGDLTDVDSLTFTPGTSNRNLYFNASGMRIITTNSSNWATGISVYNNANTTKLGDVCGAFGGENSFSYSYFGGSYNSPGMVILPSNKYVGIGTTSPTYKLHVSGTAYATGGFQNGSDIRYKHVLQDLALTVAQVAAAPSFLFRWTDGTADGVQAGTSAQYWQQVMPQVVTESAGRLSMQYDKAALAAAITIAREVETLEQRVDRLEKENYKLKKKVKELERRAA